MAEEDAEWFSMLQAPQKSITALWAAVGASAEAHGSLSAFAVRHLSAPPASSATERLFSQVKNVYTDKRRRMKPGTLITGMTQSHTQFDQEVAKTLPFVFAFIFVLMQSD